MDRTIKLKLELSGEDKQNLRQTMVLSNQVFDEIAEYGFEQQTHSKVSIHHETYYPIISKEIAAIPFDVFAIEDLTSIRVQSRTKGIEFTRKLNNWSFYQLEQFLRYKGQTKLTDFRSGDLHGHRQNCSTLSHAI